MQTHDLKPASGARKGRKRVGRGPGSGRGKTSGRGQTGQNARAGRGILNSLEGGQVPLIRRLPKVGFRPHRPRVFQPVALKRLQGFPAGTVVTPQLLKEHRIIQSVYRPFKVLADGDISAALTVQAYAFSKTAADKIVKAGGKVERVKATQIKAAQTASKPADQGA